MTNDTTTAPIGADAERAAFDRWLAAELPAGCVSDMERGWKARAAIVAPTPAAQGDALTDSYVQQVPDMCDRIVWRGSYYHLPIDAARAAEEGENHDQ